MAVNSVKVGAKAKSGYPKLLTDGHYIYYAFAKDKAVLVNAGTVAVSESAFYVGGSYNFETSPYKPYEGSITLSNA